MNPIAQEVRRWLDGYVQDEQYIDAQYDRIRELEVEMEGLKAVNVSDMPKAPSIEKNKMEKMLIKKEKIQKQIEALEDKHRIDEEYLKNILKNISNARMRNVIERRYMDGAGWDQVLISVYGREKDFIYRTKNYERRMYRAHARAIDIMSMFW